MRHSFLQCQGMKPDTAVDRVQLKASASGSAVRTGGRLTTFAHHVFRGYDIRGLAGSDIDTAFARRLGSCFATILTDRQAPLVVGRDVRLSGPPLHRALIEGITQAGIDVLDIGMTATPLAYFATHYRQAAGCIMVTASHNPAAYNGFKLMNGKHSLHGDEIQQLRTAMNAADRPATSASPGKVAHFDPLPVYLEQLRADLHLARPLKVVVDAGNGPSGRIAPPLYRRLGCEVIELYCEPDGNFPNHHPDPTIAENLRDLAAAVHRHGADLGLAFDGDGDRLGVVDRNGATVSGDLLLLLLARRLLLEHPGATVISEVKSSQLLFNDIRQHGGTPLISRTGHSPIKEAMAQSGALLAGDLSGHFFFADRFFGFDDAAYAGGRLLELLAESPLPLDRLLEQLPATACTPEIRIDCADERKFELVEAARRHFAAAGYRIVEIDGIRLEFDDGWALLRASNTQPALVMRFEAGSRERLTELREMFEGWLHRHGI